MAVKLRPMDELVEDLGCSLGVELRHCPMPDPNYRVWKLAHRFNCAVSRKEAIAQLSEEQLYERFVRWCQSGTSREEATEEIYLLVSCALAFNREKRRLFGRPLADEMMERAESALDYRFPAPHGVGLASLRRAAGAAFEVLERSLGLGYPQLAERTRRRHERRFGAMVQAISIYVRGVGEDQLSCYTDTFEALCDMGIGIKNEIQSAQANAAQVLCILLPALARMIRMG